MLVMAFDIATSTGVALGRPGSVPRTTTINLGVRCDADAKIMKLVSAASVLIRKYKPDLVVYEAPVGGQIKNTFLVELAACFRIQVKQMGLRCELVASSTARKHFVGRSLTLKDFPGRSKAAQQAALKQVIIDRCYLLGWYVKTDDAADACAIWDYACATYARAQVAPAGGLFRG